MNERIEKLAAQAAKFSAVMALPTGESGDKLFVEKFALLIVRECIGCCEQAISDPVPESVDTIIQVKILLFVMVQTITA